uniref:BPTI/Kunitz inhibitor domain-containing protein n=1 Tax=Schistocephalus solidus TaxID=70667 RepID=A0A183T2E8_SCHSO
LTGPCDKVLRRYGFFAPMRQCLPFTYSGCEGNANNFLSKEACETKCNGNLPVRTAACQVRCMCKNASQCIIRTLWFHCIQTKCNGNLPDRTAACQVRCMCKNASQCIIRTLWFHCIQKTGWDGDVGPKLCLRLCAVFACKTRFSGFNF